MVRWRRSSRGPARCSRVAWSSSSSKTMHSVLNGIYGTSSDDANVGKWVEYAKAKHGIEVNVQTIPGLLSQELST